MEAHELSRNDELKITSSELSRRMSIDNGPTGLRFVDLTCNRIHVYIPNGIYVEKGTEFELRGNRTVLQKTIQFADVDKTFTSSVIKSIYENGEFRGMIKELRQTSFKPEFHFLLNDYSLNEDAILQLRIANGRSKSIFSIAYPQYSGGIGIVEMNLDVNDPDLESAVSSFRNALSILSKNNAIPTLGEGPVRIDFAGEYDEADTVKKLDNLKSPEYVHFFNNDLSRLREIPTDDGFHRAIVYFLGKGCGLLLLQNTNSDQNEPVRSHARLLESWLNDSQRSQYIKSTGFSTDDMSNWMHTFIKFDEAGEVVWSIDRGNLVPQWYSFGGFTEREIVEYLANKYGVKNEFGIVPPDVSKRMALSGALGERIKEDSELLHREYGKKYCDKYLALAEKFRIQEKEPFSAGWEDFQALEVLIKKLRDSKRK